ncbi:Ataxin-10 Spinocerebellar ataxia type 10 protein-like protein [Larimichthys crocea]|uniref:Ataxin-10 n=1 Tax=Larimichthys crocea TaxID=215358 RepID=A0A6G0HQZ4_LARCR|nr:Ataxin-10 Spinocerebellar ataxia type 10 protein-like protein [Larimichthys crocea]
MLLTPPPVTEPTTRQRSIRKSRPMRMIQANMAASRNNNLNISASFAGVMNEKHCPEHLQVLKTFTTELRDKEYRDAVEEEVFSGLLKVLSQLRDELQAVSGEDQDLQSVALQLQLTAECFRAQRNACVQSTRNQCVLRELGFIDVSLKVLGLLQTTNMEGRDDIFEPLRCGIQFLGNLAVGNQMCKDDIWQLSFPNLLLQLLSVDDVKTINYTSMVLHTCLDETKVEELSEPQNIQLALRVMELCRTQPDLDWTVLIATQHFLKSSALVESMYSGMSHHERVTLLELLFAQLREEDSDECGVPPSVARFLASSFQKGCGAVLTLATGSASSDEVLQEALTVISLLDVLCEMTSDLRQFMFLQDHPDLLMTTVELLEQVHAIGKASKNIFSAAQNFSFSGDGDASPVISFKAHLIRLIGNLCHSNTNNQNKVRELEGIPLILDNCNIDSNNPFISQWAIFAIRNLLEHNTQNQELVAALERRGTTDYSALKELGFLVEERDGSLLLKSVRKDS